MKNTTKLLLVIGGTIALSSQVNAGDRLLSPRAQANQIVRVAGAENKAEKDCCVSNTLGVAAMAKASGAHSVLAGTSKTEPNLNQRETARIGSPRGLQQLRESGREIQIAPLK